MVGAYLNRIGKLGKMMRSQFSTKVSQITIFDINDWERINVNIQKNSSLEQNSSLHNQVHDKIINPRYLKEENEKNLKFPQE